MRQCGTGCMIVHLCRHQTNKDYEQDPKCKMGMLTAAHGAKGFDVVFVNEREIVKFEKRVGDVSTLVHCCVCLRDH